MIVPCFGHVQLVLDIHSNDTMFLHLINGATIVFWTCTTVAQCFLTYTMIVPYF